MKAVFSLYLETTELFTLPPLLKNHEIPLDLLYVGKLRDASIKWRNSVATVKYSLYLVLEN